MKYKVTALPGSHWRGHIGEINMNLEEIKAFLNDNKDSEEVKGFLAELRTPSLDDVKNFLEQNEEGSKWFQSEKDRYVTKGIDTWKTNNLDKLKQDIKNELNPPKTETEKRLAALELELEQERKSRLRETLRNSAYKHATEKGLPVDLLDYMIGEDENTTLSNLETLEKVWMKEKQNLINQQFKQNGREPHKSQSDQFFSKEQIESMSEEDIIKNWDKIERSLENQ